MQPPINTASDSNTTLPLASSSRGSSERPVLERRVGRVAGSRIPSLIKGMTVKSPTFRAVVISGMVGALAAGALFAVVASPPAWMIAAAVGGGVSVGLLLGVSIQLPFKGKQQISFEITTIARLLKRKNHDTIITIGEQKIVLGALPNRLCSRGEKLVRHEGIGAVVSVNEPWERRAVGLSVPYSETNWKDLLDADSYLKLDALDHSLLDDATLDRGADFIANQILEGQKSVYVHCRAGAGRSAMIVAAYLIKYQGFTVERASLKIKNQRSLSTIYKKSKKDRLKEYQACLERRNESQTTETQQFLIAQADFVKEQVQKGHDLYSRKHSDLAIAAYLIRHKEQSSLIAIGDIENTRQGSMIKQYSDSLNRFAGF